MRISKVYVNKQYAGLLTENDRKTYSFEYLADYAGTPVSYTMPVVQKRFSFEVFPPFFEGLLPEGYNLDAMLRKRKIDKNDYFSQLLAVGEDMVGDVTVGSVQQ
jgi:serine/threonine-protein kinase HipA